MRFKKIICAFLAIVFAVPALVVSVEAKEVEEEVSREGDYSYIELNGEAVLVGYAGHAKELILPEELGGMPLTGIRRNVFLENNTLLKIQLPAAMEDISPEQFCLCDNLQEVTVAEGNKVYTSVDGVLYQDGGKTLRLHPAAHSESYDIPEGVTKIAPYAFFTNKTLAAVTFPSTLKEIGDNAFYDCQILREVYIPDSVVRVGESAFSWCINLKELRVPDKLSDMGRSAFFPCHYVTHSENEFVTLGDDVLVAYLGESTNIKIPEGVKTVSNVFFINEELESISIPSTVETISDYAFYGCKRLKSVELHKGIKKIGDWAFFGCEKLKSVIVPTGAEIGEYSFAGCVKLETAAVNTRKIPPYAFARCDRLENFTFGPQVKEIGDYAFYFCEQLKKIDVQGKFEVIGAHAFRRVGLEKMTLGTSVKKIGRSAFLENEQLVLKVTRGSYAHKYATDNKLQMTVKEPSQKELNQIQEQEKADATFVELLFGEYLIWTIIGGAAFLLIIAALIIIIIVCKRRKRRRLTQVEAAKGDEGEKSAETEASVASSEETSFDVIEE